MANSLMLTGALLGFDVTCVAPEGYWPSDAITKLAQRHASSSGATISVTDQRGAVAGAHVVYTDVWVSMGMDDEKDRRLRDLADYQVDEAMMSTVAPDGVFMHCLPAHRGEEVSAAVCDGPRSIIFDEAENRLHAQKALMATLMSDA